jgi:hypothetical protein
MLNLSFKTTATAKPIHLVGIWTRLSQQSGLLAAWEAYREAEANKPPVLRRSSRFVKAG